MPAFKTEEEERDFWETHDVLEYSEEWDDLIIGGPKTSSINVRLEPRVKRQIEEYASRAGMEVSDMVRSWIYTGLEAEIRRRYPELSMAAESATLYAAECLRLALRAIEGQMVETTREQIAELIAEGHRETKKPTESSGRKKSTYTVKRQTSKRPPHDAFA
ncbi:MAG: CopG family antitoxin [Actinomycetota bacterium]